jgi:hypothetical protein
MEDFVDVFNAYYEVLDAESDLPKNPKFKDLMKTLFYSGAYKYMITMRKIVKTNMENNVEPSISANTILKIEKSIIDFLNTDVE